MKSKIYVHSTTLRNSVHRNYLAVCSGDFDSRTVKELFIDLRELAVIYRDNLLGDKREREAIPVGQIIDAVIEVGNYIAHGNRDTGIIRDIATRQIKKVNEGLEGRGDINPPVDRPLDLGAAFFGIAILTARTLPNLLVDVGTMLPQYNAQRTKFIVHILEILQGCRVQLKDDEGDGILMIAQNPINKILNLYCVIPNSKFMNRRRAELNKINYRMRNRGNIQIGFPVAYSDIALPYEDCPADTGSILVEYESYLGENGLIRLKPATSPHEKMNSELYSWFQQTSETRYPIGILRYP